MNTNDGLITPPPELFDQWEDDILNERDNVDHVLDCVWRDGFQAGADQELEACLQWFSEFYSMETWMQKDLEKFRKHRRPKPPSLKERALKALDDISIASYEQNAANTIRQALEALND